MISARILRDFKKHKVVYTCIVLFFISFFYIMFFTDYIPFFWDEILFHENYFKQSSSELVHEFFSMGSDSISGAPRTVYAAYFKTLFYLAGYDIIIFRAVKAVIFAMFIVLLFYFSNRYIKDYISSLLFSFFVMFSFSLYIQTLVYAEPYLYSEVFKIAAFYLFLKDFNQKKTSVARQMIIGVLGFLAIRTYQPTYSIPLILALYILLSRFKNIKRYFFLLAFLFATNFPFKKVLSFNFADGEIYHLNFVVIKKLLFSDVLSFIISPVINLQDLYYEPFIAIITFFGFWLFVIAAIIYVLRKRISRLFPQWFITPKKSSNKGSEEHVLYSQKPLIIFLCAWIIGELPLWLFLPEHAIRYANEILVPFLMLCFILVSKTLAILKDRRKKLAVCVMILMVFFACLTNVVYTAAFRAGWGSSFVGMEKVTTYIEEQRKDNSIVLYHSMSVAEEYYPMNISKPTRYNNGAYNRIDDGVVYKQVRDMSGFSNERLENLSKNYTELYIIKRVTSFSRNEMPPINFDSNPDLRLLKVIKGDTPSLFDKMAHLAAENLKIDYTPQLFYIYKYVGYD